MKKILITGASGFIGSNLSLYFKNKGYIVYEWDRIKSDNTDEVDMENKDFIISRLKIIKPEIIINCAGSANVQNSYKNPNKDYTSNVKILKNLLESIHQLRLHNVRVIQLSSAAVYGNQSILPISENANPNPISPYAKNKLESEKICSEYIKKFNLDIKIVRIFSAYGPGLKKQIFWDIYNKISLYGKLELFGTGNESRDFIYITDLCQALFLISTQKFKETIINVANGEEVNIKTVAFIYSSILKNKEISFNQGSRIGDPTNWKADITILKKLGYKATISIDEGINNYITWVKENENN